VSEQASYVSSLKRLAYSMHLHQLDGLSLYSGLILMLLDSNICKEVHMRSSLHFSDLHNRSCFKFFWVANVSSNVYKNRSRNVDTLDAVVTYTSQ